MGWALAYVVTVALIGLMAWRADSRRRRYFRDFEAARDSGSAPRDQVDYNNKGA